jgi:hypothetical protein
MPKVRMLIRTALAAAVSLSALNAQAGAPVDLGRVAAAFGNTVMTIYPDGRTQKIWLHPDGAWDGLSRKNEPLSGKWSLKGDKVCLRQTKPPTLPFSYCTAFPTDAHIGVVWASKDFVGNPIKLTVLPGMAQAAPPPLTH